MTEKKMLMEGLMFFMKEMVQNTAKYYSYRSRSYYSNKNSINYEEFIYIFNHFLLWMLY